MTTPAMQPTSSASSADEITRMQWLLRQIIGSLPVSRDWLDPALEREAKYFGNSYIVPQVVQAPILRMRDPATTAIMLVNEWDETPADMDEWGNSAAQALRHCADHITRSMVAATIVATVPSEPVARRIVYVPKFGKAKQITTWIPLDQDIPAHRGELIENTLLYAAPSPTEQASDVRLPDDWDDKIFNEMERRFSLCGLDDDRMKNDDTQIGVEFTIAQIKAMLKSATPADKGNQS